MIERYSLRSACCSCCRFVLQSKLTETKHTIPGKQWANTAYSLNKEIGQLILSAVYPVSFIIVINFVSSAFLFALSNLLDSLLVSLYRITCWSLWSSWSKPDLTNYLSFSLAFHYSSNVIDFFCCFWCSFCLIILSSNLLAFTWAIR